MFTLLKLREKANVGSLSVIAMALAIAVVGCSGEDGKDIVVKDPARVKQAAPVTTPIPAPATLTPADTAPAQEVAVAPEPKREVSYDEAEAAYLERDYTRAQDLFTRYTERKSGNPWGFYMLGLSAWKAGDNSTAETSFEQALALNSEHVKSWINLSRVLLDSDRPAEAMDRIGHAIELDGSSGDAYRLLGRAQYQLGKIDEAIEAYQKAIQIDDQDAWSMNNLALIYIESERFADALPPLARAIELRSDIAMFHNNLGMALEHCGRFRDAENAYRVAVAADDSYENALANLGRLELVAEDAGIESIDLAALAQEFVDEIASWKTAATEDTTGGFADRIASTSVASFDNTATAVTDSTTIGDEQ